MPQRDYKSAPLSVQLGIEAVIQGLVGDLQELRAGKISVNDAVARSLLAKQIFNGMRIYLNGVVLLSEQAPVSALESPVTLARSPDADTP